MYPWQSRAMLSVETLRLSPLNSDEVVPVGPAVICPGVVPQPSHVQKMLRFVRAVAIQVPLADLRVGA